MRNLRAHSALVFLMPIIQLLVTACGNPTGEGGEEPELAQITVDPIADPSLRSDSLGYESTSPPAPAPASVIDPYMPWNALGDLSGYYELKATRLESNCTHGPEVPFYAAPLFPNFIDYPDRDRNRMDPDGNWQELELVHDTFRGYLTQRGNGLSFEVGEGMVFASWVESTSRIEDVERVGADGVTNYLDGFDVEFSGEDGADVRISGESEWVFEDDNYDPGQICEGVTHWEAIRSRPGPTEGERDFQIVLRWPADSEADLDLMLEVPVPSFSYPDIGLQDEYADFSSPASNCYSLHSVGEAPDPHGFVASFEATELAYHEEVIRCKMAAYGWWVFHVVNWSLDETVDYEIEAFWGAGVNTGPRNERSFGASESTVSPVARNEHPFILLPPSSPGSSAGLVSSVVSLRPTPRERPIGELTGTHLEFNKAAWEGSSYLEFISAMGLPTP